MQPSMATMTEPMDEALAAWEQVLAELESAESVDPSEGYADAVADGSADAVAVGSGEEVAVGSGEAVAVGAEDAEAVGDGEAVAVGAEDADAEVGCAGVADADGRARVVGCGVAVARVVGVPPARVEVGVDGWPAYAGCAPRRADEDEDDGEERDGVACSPPKPASMNGARFAGCPAMASARSATRFTSASSGRKTVRARTATVTQAAQMPPTTSLEPRRLSCSSSRSEKRPWPGAPSRTSSGESADGESLAEFSREAIASFPQTPLTYRSAKTVPTRFAITL